MAENGRISCHCPPLFDTTHTERDHPSMMMAVIEAISEVAGVEVQELPPLYETIDPNCLNQLVETDGTDSAVISFSFDDWNVFVRGDGRIRICDATKEVEAAPVFERPMR